MTIVSILLLLLFAVILCIVEVPKMLQQRMHKELIAFSVILLYGTVITILATFNVEVLNTNDLWSWIYSPFSGFMKSLLKP
jgi:uncharacterized membrane protein YwaF